MKTLMINDLPKLMSWIARLWPPSRAAGFPNGSRRTFFYVCDLYTTGCSKKSPRIESIEEA